MTRTCDCAGGQCEPWENPEGGDDAESGVTRRQFVRLLGVGTAAGALLGVSSARAARR